MTPPSVCGFDLRKWLVENTPVYLLSAVCMLGSCVLLANDTNGKSVSVTQIVTLVLTLTVYQAAMFALGAFLMLRRGVLRDGRQLLVLDAVFFCDVTFANSNLITAHLWIGLAVATVLLVLAAGRVAWLATRLGAPLPLHRYLLIVAPLVLLVAIPAWLKHMDDGHSITPRTLYSLWWLVGLLLAGGVIAEHRYQLKPAPSSRPLAAWLAPTYLLTSWLSLIAHVAFLHYVYDQTFYVAMAAPLLLVVAMVIRRLAMARWWQLERVPALPWVIILAAVIFGLNGPAELGVPAVLNGRLALSPPLLTLVAAYLAIVYLYLLRHALAYLLSGLAAGLLYMLGPTWSQVGHAAAVAWGMLAKAGRVVIPRTRLAWGIAGVVVSFLLLGLGALISLRKPPDSLTPAAVPDSPGTAPADAGIPAAPSPQAATPEETIGAR